MTSKVEVVVYGQSITVAVDGIIKYQSDIGTIPLPAPTPAPAPTPTPTPVPISVREQVRALVAQGLDMMTITLRMQGLTAEERQYCRDNNVPGSIPPTQGNSSTDAPTTGFELASKGRPLTNTLTAGEAYLYSVPTQAGERVILKVFEVTGTPDTMNPSSTVRAPSGLLLSGPYSRRHTVHDFISPGGTLSLFVTPNVTAPLGVVRN